MKRLKDYYVPFLNYLEQLGRDPKTIRNYHQMFHGALSDIAEMKIKKLRLIDLAKVIEGGRRHGRNGIRTVVMNFRSLLSYIKKTGQKLPFDLDDIKLPPKPPTPHRYFAIPEFEKARQGLESVFDDKGYKAEKYAIIPFRIRALWECLFATVCRISELLALDRDSISFERKEAQVQDSKNKKTRIVFFTDRALYYLREYLDRRVDDNSALFVSIKGNIRLSPITALHQLRKIKKKLGLQDFTHHTFRRGGATALLSGGMDIKSVSYVLGHASIRTTLTYYTMVSEKHAKDKHQEILGGF